MNPPPNPELELLRSGLESYLPAMNAIVAFRERIQDACERVLVDHLSDFAKALGVRLKQDDILRRDYPPIRQWDSEWTSVGVELQRIGPNRVSLWHSVAWAPSSPEDRGVSVSECVWFPKKAPYERARALFRSAPGYWYADRDVGISAPLALEETAKLEEHLTTILEQWIELWRKVGGLKALSGK